MGISIGKGRTSPDSSTAQGLRYGSFLLLKLCSCAAGVDWRSKLENQRGAVLATELKNNANKLAKWTAAAVIAGADMIRIGYVSRAHARDNMNHTILGTQVRALFLLAAILHMGLGTKFSAPNAIKLWILPENSSCLAKWTRAVSRHAWAWCA